MRGALLLGSLVLWLGCGDDGTPSTDAAAPRDVARGDTALADVGATDGSAGDSGAADASSPDAGATDTGVADAGATDAGATDAGAADAGAVDAGSMDAGAADAGNRDAASSASVTIRDLSVYANCMPVVAPDPILAFWRVDVSGASGSSATLTSATLTITGASTVTQTLTVDVGSIPLTGGSGSAAQRKTGATPPAASACSSLCGGGTAKLDLVFDVDGAAVASSAETMFGCVY